MQRKTYNKRVLSIIVAMALVFTCFLTSYAGTLTSFLGDEGFGTGEVSVGTNGGRVYYTIGDDPRESSRTGYIGSPPLGTVCIFEAEDTATRAFMYWQDEYAHRVYSYDRVITVTVGSRISLRAVFANVSDTKHFVSFVNYGNTVMKDTVMVNNGADVSFPTDTKLPGFTFRGWSKSANEIKNDDGDMIVYPQYTVNDESFTVNITNEAYVSGAGTYSNFQTVNIKAEEKNGSGETFSYWKDSEDTIVSYERNYSFRINYDVTLTAVYGESVTPQPVVRITKINRDEEDMKLTFYAERSVPDSYTVVSHGMLMATGNIPDAQMLVSEAGELDTSSIRKVYGASNEQCGTFSLAKAKVSYVTTVTARPFVIVQNAAGEQFVAYGDTVRTTNQQQGS
ncbi:MAG: InlB B-repeat-containing protein [Clostridia bacterium]|nr:InlB B-repeat-containing protein [Clostridia bacterium]